jgi:SAM-dependent methyltransferase
VTFAAQLYWKDRADGLTFTHPLPFAWLEQVPKSARVIDYGCGYGRTLAELAAAGWRNALGVDFSDAMVERGRREHPDLAIRRIDGLPIAEPDASFDLAILFAVLTTIADEDTQSAVMRELRRLLRPGGWLCLSDHLLQDDDRYRARYQAGMARHGVLGVWVREDGGVFRHQTRERLNALLEGFEPTAERLIPVKTLSGAPAVAIQVMARRV